MLTCISCSLSYIKLYECQYLTFNISWRWKSVSGIFANMMVCYRSPSRKCSTEVKCWVHADPLSGPNQAGDASTNLRGRHFSQPDKNLASVSNSSTTFNQSDQIVSLGSKRFTPFQFIIFNVGSGLTNTLHSISSESDLAIASGSNWYAPFQLITSYISSIQFLMNQIWRSLWAETGTLQLDLMITPGAEKSMSNISN
jgi:hypothetical protein